MRCSAWILLPALLGLCCGIPKANARLSPEILSQIVEGASIVDHSLLTCHLKVSLRVGSLPFPARRQRDARAKTARGRRHSHLYAPA